MYEFVKEVMETESINVANSLLADRKEGEEWVMLAVWNPTPQTVKFSLGRYVYPRTTTTA
jgi:hypothetical protein